MRQRAGHGQKSASRFVFRAPCGERPPLLPLYALLLLFQSTLPCGERPVMRPPPISTLEFQSTLPHGERLKGAGLSPRTPRFNPRSRVGNGRIFSDLTGQPLEFQSTLPCGERPATSDISRRKTDGFNPRSRAGSGCTTTAATMAARSFQSTLPHGERLIFSENQPVVGIVSIHAPARGAACKYRPPC